MYEHGAVWTMEGADGTTTIFNDGASGLYLEEVSGFDSPEIRTQVEDLPEWDGAIASDSWLSHRPVTLRGRVGVGLTAAQRNAAVVNLQRAARGLRIDGTLKSQASGLPAMQIGFRVQSIRLTPGYVKEFQISVVCADPRIVSQALNTQTQQQTGTPASPGARFPLDFTSTPESAPPHGSYHLVASGFHPAGSLESSGGLHDHPPRRPGFPFGGKSTGAGKIASVSCSNAGNFDAVPLIRIYGPVTNPIVKNVTTDRTLFLDGLTLAGAEWVEIDIFDRTVLRSDGTNLYHKLRFPGSSFWLLQPGANTIELWGSASAGQTELNVSWRDTWV